MTSDWTALDNEPGEVNEPRCDICGEPEDHEPGFIEYDWNGDTGNHLSCERNERRYDVLAEAIERGQASPAEKAEYEAMREARA